MPRIRTCGAPLVTLLITTLARDALAVREDPSLRSIDELVQLYSVGVGYAALGGRFGHDLGAVAAWPWITGGGLGLANTVLIAAVDGAGGWSYGQPQAIVSDAVLGSEIGAAWIWHDAASNPRSERWSPALQSGLLLAGATVGAGAGLLRYELRPSSPASAAFTGSIGLWGGSLAGLLTASVVSAEERAASGTAALALGLELGVVGSALLRRVFEPESIAWVRWFDAGAVVGSALGAATCAALTDTKFDERPALACASGGLVLGISTAVLTAPHLIRASDEAQTGQSNISVAFGPLGPQLHWGGSW